MQISWQMFQSLIRLACWSLRERRKINLWNWSEFVIIACDANNPSMLISDGYYANVLLWMRILTNFWLEKCFNLKPLSGHLTRWRLLHHSHSFRFLGSSPHVARDPKRFSLHVWLRADSHVLRIVTEKDDEEGWTNTFFSLIVRRPSSILGKCLFGDVKSHEFNVPHQLNVIQMEIPPSRVSFRALVFTQHFLCSHTFFLLKHYWTVNVKAT